MVLLGLFLISPGATFCNIFAIGTQVQCQNSTSIIYITAKPNQKQMDAEINAFEPGFNSDSLPFVSVYAILQQCWMWVDDKQYTCPDFCPENLGHYHGSCDSYIDHDDHDLINWKTCTKYWLQTCFLLAELGSCLCCSRVSPVPVIKARLRKSVVSNNWSSVK